MSLQLLRSILPSWSFYSDTGLNPILLVLVGSDKAQLSEKKSLYSTSQRKISHFFLNPLNNLKLRERTLLFHLIIESQKLSPQDLVKSSTFLAVKFLVNNSCDQKYFQFKLFNQVHSEEAQLVIVSPIYLRELNA